MGKIMSYTDDEIRKLRNLFKKYKKEKDYTLRGVAKELKRGVWSVRKWLRRLFGDEYTKVTSLKLVKKLEKVDKTQVKSLFQEYKYGKPMKEIAKKVQVSPDYLRRRMGKLIEQEYKKIVKKRRYGDSGRVRQKISDEKIKELFDEYKKSKTSLDSLAKNVGISWTSLRVRFEKLFGEAYKEISYARRIERKLTTEKYIEAFKRYKKTDISLIDLSEELKVSIGCIAMKFRSVFGDEYTKIAKMKSDKIELKRKGKVFEEIAFEYLKLLGLKAEYTSEKCPLKDSLKRPDFIIDDKFVEVKAYSVPLEGIGMLKGYREIIKSYLGKQVKESGKILSGGMIISLRGFSPEIKPLAQTDEIELIGPRQLKEIFRTTGREDLLQLMSSLN